MSCDLDTSSSSSFGVGRISIAEQDNSKQNFPAYFGSNWLYAAKSKLESYLEGLDRTFLDLSSKMAEPFCKVSELVYRMITPLDPLKFNNCERKTDEIAVRALIGTGALLTGALALAAPLPFLTGSAALGLGSKFFKAVGYSLQKEGYTHVRGTAAEKTLAGAVKVMNWNVCGIAGGLHLDHGGVVSWKERLDALVEKIEAEDPDVLVLQEIYDTALGEALIAKLGDRYAHFFTHLGASVWGSEGGCMVLTKCAVQRFSHTTFTTNDWTLCRGYATLEIKASPTDASPCARIIGTHLIHGSSPLSQINRVKQLAQIVESLANKTLPRLPTLLAGDLNIERDEPEAEVLSAHLHHGYTGSEPTCTNRLVAQWTGKSCNEEVIDYISLFKKAPSLAVTEEARLVDCHLVRAFDETYNTKTALSDHHGLVVTLKIGQ